MESIRVFLVVALGCTPKPLTSEQEAQTLHSEKKVPKPYPYTHYTPYIYIYIYIYTHIYIYRDPLKGSAVPMG